MNNREEIYEIIRKQSVSMSENEYRREVILPSYSLLAKYDESGFQGLIDYFEDKIIDNEAIRIGNIVDNIITKRNKEIITYDETLSQQKRNQAIEIEQTYENLDSMTLEDISSHFGTTSLKGKSLINSYQKVLDLAIKIRKSKISDSILVAQSEMDIANIMIEELMKENSETRKIIDSNYTLFQIPIITEEQCGISLNSIRYKSLLDMAFIEEDGTVHIIDLKTTKDIRTFYDSYIKRRYYFQSIMYSNAIKRLLENNGIIDGKVKFSFMVVDREGKTAIFNDSMADTRTIVTTRSRFFKEIDWKTLCEEVYDIIMEYKETGELKPNWMKSQTDLIMCDIEDII